MRRFLGEVSSCYCLQGYCLQGILQKLNADPATELGELDDRMRDEQAQLQKLRNGIRAKLQDAQQVEMGKKSTTLWLTELRDLAEDIEDVLDDFEYEELRRRAANRGRGGGGCSCAGSRTSTSTSGADCSLLELLNQVRHFLASPSRPRQPSLLDAMVSRVDGIWSRYDVISRDPVALDQLLGLWIHEGATPTGPSRQVTETSSFLKDPEVFGRDRVKEEIVEFLTAPAERLSVLALVGIGGIGKTTLAQFVYNDQRVTDYFPQKIWVHVSHGFDVKRVTRLIIEHVDPQMSLQQMDNLDVLQLSLAERLRDRCFLLVLDDVWYEDNRYIHFTKWQELCAPLNGGGENGSKVLITTRSARAADIPQPVKMIELETLAFDDCWSLLKKHALGDGKPLGCQKLEVIGKEIVKKLNGVPLAAMTIGSLLKIELEEEAWRSILESELWELEQVEGGILPALRLSYKHLPPHLKPCFTYFSVFPKGQRFDKLELVQLWMALGYIESHKKKRMEDVGNNYLSYLIGRSLVQSVDDKYFVHDLLHDLGRFILQHDHCTIESNSLHKISTKDQHQRHLSLLVSKRLDLNELEKLQSFKKLHTLSFVFHHQAILQIPFTLFKSLACIRVLNLSSGNIQSLPDSIDNLRHLRYLDLRGTPIKYLPDAVCSLYMLQTLRLQGCDHLGILPQGMSKLISLRHLEARQELVSGICGIGKLVHLQELDVFSISEGHGIKIEDLRYMDELQGILGIQNLQRVGNKEEARLANLNNKKYINELWLEWGTEDCDMNERNSELQEAVLDALSPPPKLRELTIKCYGGTKFPSWMKHLECMSGLESLSLQHCQRWESLPPRVRELPFLKTLDITCIPQLKELPHLPSTLINLRIQEVGLDAISGLQELPQLQALIICNIPGLMELPPLPTTLRKLIVKNLGLKALPEFDQVPKGMTEGQVENSSPVLHQLKITGCQKLKSLQGILKYQLPELAVLSIKNCKKLEHWPDGEGFLSTLRTLQKELNIKDCPKLMPLPEGYVISPSLKKLTIKGCPMFADRSFFSQLPNLKNLTRARDMYVERQYQDLESCSDEALRHMGAVNCLTIQFNYHNDEELAFNISLVYDIEHLPRQRCLDIVPYRRLTLNIKYKEEECNCNSVLHTCLRHHQLCSSLFFLFLHNMPYSGFLLQQGGDGQETARVATPDLASLEELVIVGCHDMERLPVETLLCRLRQLNHLSIIGCPELTLSSVGEAICSLPSLAELSIMECPMTTCCTSPSLSPHASSSSPSSSPPPPVQSLTTDDVALLANRQFARGYLTSLHDLVICLSGADSFQVAEEEWMRSLRRLSFVSCPNLQELPPDFKKLALSLEALCIKDCPRLRCVPRGGLPASLELLTIAGSPMLEVEDWPKVDHVRLIILDGAIVQGSYTDYEKLIRKGKAVL